MKRMKRLKYRTLDEMDFNTRNGFDAPKENINVLFTLSFIEIKICSSRVNVLATIGKLPMGVISLICFRRVGSRINSNC